MIITDAGVHIWKAETPDRALDARQARAPRTADRVRGPEQDDGRSRSPSCHPGPAFMGRRSDRLLARGRPEISQAFPLIQELIADGKQAEVAELLSAGS